MCGIAGIIRWDNIKVEYGQLKSMTDSLIHRGPDGEGQWINKLGNVGLGHRRLSIIDLTEKSKQPMQYGEGRFCITYNGEIYNYIELRFLLVSKGYQFVSNGDTEVLLALYHYKGKDMLQMLDGMFAFAIWDEVKKELFCARDRFGEKPFYYYKDEKQLVFASEIKAILANGINAKIDQDKLSVFVNDGTVRNIENSCETYYEGIKSLDAASVLIINDKDEIIIQNYWNLDKVEINSDISFDAASAKFYHLVNKSVERRLRSDVAVGSSLSGGIDSSTIVMLVDRMKGPSQVQKTFSARFKDFSKDEGKYIEQVISSCKNIEAHSVWPDENGLIQELVRLVYYQEEPFGSASIFAQWKVMELAKKNNVTVLLDGQGADEYLAGYLPEYKLYIYQLFHENRKLYEKEYAQVHEKQGARFFFPKYEDTETTRMKMGRWKRTILCQPINFPKLNDKLKFLISVFGLKELLRYADRNSMAHSREVRLPFLSHELVEFVFSLPDHFKLREGWTKYILRSSMNTILPNEICWRKDKVGYEPPQNVWLQNKKILEIINEQKIKYGMSVINDKSYVNSSSWRLFLSYFYQK